eukprot:CAMPEP_0202826536 /NCGR_PEP_ID=MMETSP1389-20130828/13676_1 /ASSEMBLY_ACC=CAM_ASM_000865 /TAXON_ID=302021 /ORGANISM="Rhodomonas sp., Strain CCMP768" /LENGTH=73 /DNA_ID=CAMNT_0049499843 /DNA_START=400 /DNA_END=618 /DNA_ORIENTATION=+
MSRLVLSSATRELMPQEPDVIQKEYTAIVFVAETMAGGPFGLYAKLHWSATTMAKDVHISLPCNKLVMCMDAL